MTTYIYIAVIVGLIATIHYTLTHIKPAAQNAFKSQIILAVILTFIVKTAFAPVVVFETIRAIIKHYKLHRNSYHVELPKGRKPKRQRKERY